MDRTDLSRSATAGAELIVNPLGRAMSGKWLGFGKNFKVNTGEWELTWVDRVITPRALREYHLKV